MRWAGESSSRRLALELVPPGHVATPDPHVAWEVRMAAGGLGSEASAVSSELPFLRDTWHLRTHSQAGNRSRAVGLVRKGPGPWGLAVPSFARSYG